MITIFSRGVYLRLHETDISCDERLGARLLPHKICDTVDAYEIASLRSWCPSICVANSYLAGALDVCAQRGQMSIQDCVMREYRQAADAAQIALMIPRVEREALFFEARRRPVTVPALPMVLQVVLDCDISVVLLNPTVVLLCLSFVPRPPRARALL